MHKENIDLDISNLSPKARRKLARYICLSNPDNMKLVAPSVFAFILTVASVITGYYINGFDGGAYGLICGFAIWLILLIIVAIRLGNGIEKFIHIQCARGIYPKCFECGKDLTDSDASVCPSCGKDVTVKMFVDDEKKGLISLRYFTCPNLRSKNSNIFTTVTSAIIQFTVILCMLFFYFKINDFSEKLLSYNYNAHQAAILDYQDCKYRYFEAVEGDPFSPDRESGKYINGIPVWYKFYDKKDSKMNLANKTNVEKYMNEYNKTMFNYIRGNMRGFKKISPDSPVLARTCPNDNTTRVKFDSKYYIGNKVKIHSEKFGQTTGTIKTVTIKEDGLLTYGIKLDNRNEIFQLTEPEITVIK